MTAPAYIHVDLDNLWAIAECYGIAVPAAHEHFVLEDALPRLAGVFDTAGVKSTLFVVGRDLEHRANVDALRHMQALGHTFGNHSYSHSLRFRTMSQGELYDEIARSHGLIESELAFKPIGFRAPGYGASSSLLRVLADFGYAYDSSSMPSPYGFVFRAMDKRIRAQHGDSSLPAKTQYPVLGDTWQSLRPSTVTVERAANSDNASILEYPVATAPLLRLPFQAGVCMRLGWRYFETLLHSFLRKPDLPFIFLLHAADAADFRQLNHPFFSRSGFFAKDVQEKVDFLARAIHAIAKHRPISLLEADLGNRMLPG